MIKMNNTFDAGDLFKIVMQAYKHAPIQGIRGIFVTCDYIDDNARDYHCCITVIKGDIKNSVSFPIRDIIVALYDRDWEIYAIVISNWNLLKKSVEMDGDKHV
jgi:hypothetical protein